MPRIVCTAVVPWYTRVSSVFVRIKHTSVVLRSPWSSVSYKRTLSTRLSRKMDSEIPVLNLNSEVKIPVLGYGTWQAKDKDLEEAVEAALETGYRHIDTAHVYENEKIIGTVLKRWIDSGKITRKDIFLVTKLPPGGMYSAGVSKYLKRSLSLLQVDYVDLYLIHVPFGFRDVEGNLHPITQEGKIDMDRNTDHISIWKAMEDQVDAGLTKAIGISNFNEDQIRRILDNARIRPCNLQIELHAYNQQNELVSFCQKNNIVVTAYSPLGSPGLSKFMAQFGKQIDLPDILGNHVVTEIAKKHKRTAAQVLLRHIVQKGIVAIPKSTNKERLRQNMQIWDFNLDDMDMKCLNELDVGLRILDFAAFPGIKEHKEYPFTDKK